MSKNNKNQKNRVLMLTESAAMIAIATVLSLVKIIDMPFGGSVTACSMLPLLIIGYRYGTRWGLLTSFTFGLIQMFLGMNNLSYATSVWAAIAIILLDYLVAFMVLGLSGIFRKFIKNQAGALGCAAVVTGVLRYLCHVISGCTVWAGVSVPTKDAFIYSLSYNLTYMLPEIIILTMGAILISRLLDFSQTDIKRIIVKRTTSKAAIILSAAGDVSLVAGIVTAVVFIAPFLQAEDGTFFLGGLVNVNWIPVIIALGIGMVLFAICLTVAVVLKKAKEKKTV